MTFSVTLGLLKTALRIAIVTLGVDMTVNVPSVILLIVALYIIYILKLGFETQRRKRR